MRVITAPKMYISEPSDVRCFLAGGITKCHDWQSKVISYLKDMESNGVNLDKLVIFNPRRDNFPIDNPNAAENQITWEFDHLSHAHIFSMYFCKSESDQPICMYELGRNIVEIQNDYGSTWRDRIIISVESGYSRSNDVVVQTKLATNGLVPVDTNSNPKNHAAAIIYAYRKRLIIDE